MKNVFLMLVMTIALSCSLNKTEREARNTIDGTWVLNEISYGATGTFDAVLFNDTSSNCFEKSKWFFKSNNSMGSYSILSPDCPTGVRNIRWSSNEISKDSGKYDFTMKFVDEKNKDIQKNTGYRMDLNYLDEDSMTLIQTVNFEGKPFKINLNFTRVTQ